MSIVRGLDGAGDWTFGRGANNYKSNVQAIAQNVQTRVSSFLGDCFFASDQGIDWFNLLGAKNQLKLNLAISTTILNTDGISSLTQLSLILDRITRRITIRYTAQAGSVTVSNAITSPVNFLVTEGGDAIITEGGDPIIT